MSDAGLIRELELAHSLLLALVEDADEDTYRRQFHPQLSPLGWHLGHCVYTDCLWLHETLRGDDSVTAPIARLYTPPRVPKAERGALLPDRHDMLAWAGEVQSFNRYFLEHLRPEWQDHPLMENDYLVHFLLQHNSQHYETMVMVLTQKALSEPAAEQRPPMTFPQPAAIAEDRIEVAGGHYRVGGHRPIACDNEVPLQHAELGPFAIARHPVSNAEYLAFMEDGGYRRDDCWDEQGRDWLQHSGAHHPEHWRQYGDGKWYGIGMHGAYELADSEPVSGVCHHEARAFAAWAGARLPHEYQWEAACRTTPLEQTGRVWEWCDNTFHPYQGFKPFPYREYSEPWFDQRHFTLRGGSLHTRPCIKRPSFRNFYEADKRHIFSGLRLLF